MSHFGSGVEQALHSLLYLVGSEGVAVPSARDVAEFQGISVSFVAKHFTKLEKAGIVQSSEGVRGGFRLSRPPSDITVLEVVDAVEGTKPLFQCREIRQGCVLFEGDPPGWATSGVCGIHGVMLEAERKMRESLAGVSLSDIAEQTAKKIPNTAVAAAGKWFAARQETKGASHG